MATALQTLIDRRAAAWADAQEYNQRVDRGDTLTAEDTREWERSLNEVDDLTAQITMAERSAALPGFNDPAAPPAGFAPAGIQGQRDGLPAGMLRRSDSYAATVRSKAADWDPEHENLSIGKVLRGVISGNWDGAEAERRAMGTTTGSAGGYTVPTTLSSQVIDRARAQTRVVEAGAITMQMETQEVNIPRILTDPVVAWRGEHDQITPVDFTFGSLTLTAKSLATIVKVSVELLQDGVNAGRIIDDVLAKAIAQEWDRAALFGSGTNDEPTGVASHATSQTVLGSGNGLVPTDYEFMVDAIGDVLGKNHTPTGVMLAPRTLVTMAKFTDQTDQPLQAPGLVTSVAQYPTNQIPTNQTVGTNADCSSMIVGDWSQLVLGLRSQMQIRPLLERYADNNEVGVLVALRGDIGVLHPDAFARVAGIRA